MQKEIKWKREKGLEAGKQEVTHPDFPEQIADDVECRYSGGRSQRRVAAEAVRQNCARRIFFN